MAIQCGARRGPPQAVARSAFTLVEILLVIGIIAVLISLLLPALNRSRDFGLLTTCLSNLRGQGSALHAYTVDYQGRFPPKMMVNYFTGEHALINGILARNQGQPIVDPKNEDFPRPTGIWRCPDVPGGELWTHIGGLHHAPNRWLFNNVISYDGQEYDLSADAPPGWRDRFGTPQWRQVTQVRRPSDVIALIDNVEFFMPAHAHREGFGSIGLSQDLVIDFESEVFMDKRGSHMSIAKRAAVFVDGHAEALPWTNAYWFDQLNEYHPGGNPAATSRFYRREVEHFLWFIGPGE